jgi:hypothetical protein
MTGETPKARAIVSELEERAQHTFVSPYHLAYVYTGLGEMDRAMDLLERAVADRTGATYSIKGLVPVRTAARASQVSGLDADDEPGVTVRPPACVRAPHPGDSRWQVVPLR